MFASHNPDNIAKGGVAIIVLNKHYKSQLVDSDCDSVHSWADLIEIAHTNCIPRDAVKGRYITIKISLPNDKQLFISEIYAPSNSPTARQYFYKYLDTHLTAADPMIVVGDFNNVEDPDEDIIRTIQPTAQGQHEDLTTFFRFCGNRQLCDSYLSTRDDEFWEPRLMTNKSAISEQSTTYSRIDRFYHSPELHDKVYIENFTCRTAEAQPIDIISSHNPIDLNIHIETAEPDIECFHDIWRMNVYIATQKAVRDHLNKLKRDMWNQCKDKDPEAET